MKISESGLKFLTQREGSRSKVYLDAAGLPSIGVGHLLTKDELSSGKILISGMPVCWRAGLSDEQIAELLHQDLSYHEIAINRLIIVPLTQNQFDVLVSLSFNIGVKAFTHSTLRRRLNRGEYDRVPNQLRRWIYCNGRVINGLVNRRELEVKLWNT